MRACVRGVRVCVCVCVCVCWLTEKSCSLYRVAFVLLLLGLTERCFSLLTGRQALTVGRILAGHEVPEPLLLSSNALSSKMGEAAVQRALTKRRAREEDERRRMLEQEAARLAEHMAKESALLSMIREGRPSPPMSWSSCRSGAGMGDEPFSPRKGELLSDALSSPGSESSREGVQSKMTPGTKHTRHVERKGEAAAELRLLRKTGTKRGRSLRGAKDGGLFPADQLCDELGGVRMPGCVLSPLTP